VGHSIVFGNQQSGPLVVGYVDLDYAGDLDNRRLTTGYVGMFLHLVEDLYVRSQPSSLLLLYLPLKPNTWQ